MSFVDHLCESRTQLELARMVVQVAKENAALRDRAGVLEHELFWTNVAERKEKEQQMQNNKETAVVQSFPLDGGKEVRREQRVNGTHGWLLFDGRGLVRGLNVFEQCFIDAALTAGGAPAQPAGLSFQHRVQPWMMACFGAMIAGDRAERNHRFLEEALELVQACGCTQEEAHQLVDYVYGRPVGDTPQEVGGVMVTLAALCLAQGIDMHNCGETELARIWTKVEQIRAKQATKPKYGPLPGAAAPISEDTASDDPIGDMQAEARQAKLEEFVRAARTPASAGSIGEDAEFNVLLRKWGNADQTPDTVAERERRAFFALVAHINDRTMKHCDAFAAGKQAVVDGLLKQLEEARATPTEAAARVTAMWMVSVNGEYKAFSTYDEAECERREYEADCGAEREDPEPLFRAATDAPATSARNDDPAEVAYWNFDARHKGYGPWKLCPQSERDAFKQEYRNAFAIPAQKGQDLGDYYRRRAQQLVREAQGDRFVITINATPRQPLAMGKFDLTVDVREARGRATEGGAA